VIMAGTGGMGVLVAARTLAEAGGEKYPYVTWMPSLTAAPRGQPCEATVVLSNEFVSSPLVWRPQALVMMEAAQLKLFSSRLLPQGIIITEKAGLEEVGRQDVRVVAVPALETALSMGGDTMAANLVLLGAYIQATQVVPPQAAERLLEKRFAGREQVLSKNLRAFREGIKIAKEVMHES